MTGYTKLFASILDSTVWQQDSDTRVVWVTLLAMSNQHGEVEASIPGLARRAGVTLEACERALGTFQQPDKYSRTPDHEGRRIETIDGGWLILNRAKYRDRMSEEDKRERDRIRQQRHRDKCHAKGVTSVTCHAGHNKTEAETETKTEKNIESAASAAPPPKTSSKQKRGTAIPEDFQPNAKHRALATELGIHDVASEREKFIDHHTARGTLLKDWDAGFRTWLRKARDFAGRNGGAPAARKPTPASHYLDTSTLIDVHAQKAVQVPKCCEIHPFQLKGACGCGK
jgi:hypothetical protein